MTTLSEDVRDKLINEGLTEDAFKQLANQHDLRLPFDDGHCPAEALIMYNPGLFPLLNRSNYCTSGSWNLLELFLLCHDAETIITHQQVIAALGSAPSKPTSRLPTPTQRGMVVSNRCLKLLDTQKRVLLKNANLPIATESDTLLVFDISPEQFSRLIRHNVRTLFSSHHFDDRDRLVFDTPQGQATLFIDQRLGWEVTAVTDLLFLASPLTGTEGAREASPSLPVVAPTSWPRHTSEALATGARRSEAMRAYHFLIVELTEIGRDPFHFFLPINTSPTRKLVQRVEGRGARRVLVDHLATDLVLSGELNEKRLGKLLRLGWDMSRLSGFYLTLNYLELAVYLGHVGAVMTIADYLTKSNLVLPGSGRWSLLEIALGGHFEPSLLPTILSLDRRHYVSEAFLSQHVYAMLRLRQVHEKVFRSLKYQGDVPFVLRVGHDDVERGWVAFYQAHLFRKGDVVVLLGEEGSFRHTRKIRNAKEGVISFVEE
jgi:hypothetical protein